MIAQRINCSKHQFLSGACGGMNLKNILNIGQRLANYKNSTCGLSIGKKSNEDKNENTSEN